MSGTQDEIPPPPPPQETQQTPTQQTPHTVSTIKLPILKKGEYDIWAMKLEHYLAHTDYPIWEVIQNGNGPVSVTTDTSGQIKILPPKTAEEVVARERERKARTTLLMAIPEDHLAKFHKMTDAKEMWNAIKSRFGGNDESKKMQKYILKQQFEGFTVSNTDGIHKGYERFQSLLSQLEIHGAGVSTEDANQKFLRSLPLLVTSSTASSSNLQNVAFVSEKQQYLMRVSTRSMRNLPVDEYDLEEMDLKWQVAMISMRIKKFYKKTGRKLQFDAKEPVGFDKTKVESINCHKTGHFARECRTKEDNRRRDGWNPGNKDGSRTGKKEESKALVTVDGESVDWTTHSEDDENYAFMASNSSGSDTQVTSCSNECKESYANLKRLYDAQREQLSDASVEIKAYTQGLKKVEAQLVAHQQGQLWYEQKIKFMKIDLDDKTDVLTYHKKLLAKAQKEKDDLEVIVDKWNHSSKNLGKIVNHHMSARDKFGLGDFENPPLNKRLVKTSEMQAVPPPMTGNYLPSGPDIEIDDSQYTYGPEKTQPSESESQTTELDTLKCESGSYTFLPNTFWAEAVSTACYVLNRVLVTKPHNKTPYELLTGKIPIISYIRPFGCHVTILNTIDHLGKFAGKSDEGFLVGYSLQSKAFRVYNLETKRVEENMHINFLENKPNVAGKGPNWLFDLDYLTDSMNYHPIRSENQANQHAGQQEANQNAGTEDIIEAGDSKQEDESAQDCFVLPIWPSYSSTITLDLKTDEKRDGPREEEQVFMDELERLKRQEKEANEEAEALRKKFEHLVIKEGDDRPSSTNIFSTVSTPAKASSTNLVNTVSLPVSTASLHEGLSLSDPTNPEEDDSEIPPLEDIYQNSTDGIFTTSSYDDEGAVADFTNLETVVNVSPIPTSRIHSTHPKALILGDPTLAVQIRSKLNKSSRAHAFVSYVLVNLPYGKKAIGTKWVYRNKKDEKGVIVRNKARLVAQGHKQEEGIDYDEVFAPVARIEAIRIFLAFASYMGFIVYQMVVKSAFLYGKIDKEVYVSQPPGFLDPKYPQKVYKVVKALYGLHQAPRAWYATLSTFLLKNGYKRGTIDKTLFIKKDKHDIILVQIYVDDIIFGSTKKS
ncbi:putative ribonuclease H-like domain-containing protein [Tanacetum coccineum]